MRTMRTERTDAMDRLKPRSKATKLRPLMRLIEAKIEEGVQHADILQWLHREGLVCRRHKILLDIELARFYGVPTKRLNEQVRRNRERFPEDFMFQVSIEEFE